MTDSKNTNLKSESESKSKKIIVTQNSVRVNLTPEELLEQEYAENVEEILNQTVLIRPDLEKAASGART